MQAYNSLTHSVEPIPESKPLKCYICGPTVYSSSHLGHARTYITFDLIRRIIEDYFDRPLIWGMNITDIDDKIIARSNGSPSFARHYEREFFADMKRLNVKPPDMKLRVTEVIPNIIEYISDLINAGHAYVKGGDVYFSISSAKDYARMEPASGDVDFVLWKSAKPGEPSFPSPWGRGRPGWHIECSVISHMFFGDEMDIHCGGIDLRFPHHTNECAQSESHSPTGKWCKMFLHTGQLMLNNDKMSKSTGNMITINEALSEFSGNDLRMLCCLIHWRRPINFTSELLIEAKKKCDKIFSIIHGAKCSESESDISNEINESLFNDFNLPKVIQLLIRHAHECPKYALRLMLTLGFTNPYDDKLWASIHYERKIIRSLLLKNKSALPKEFVTQLFTSLDHMRSELNYNGPCDDASCNSE